MQLLRIGQYPEAIARFEASYIFFTRHVWIDRYRSIVMMSPSAASYREAALINIAFCYAQIGQGAEAKNYYLRTLHEFPESGLAKAALTLIESIEESAKS